MRLSTHVLVLLIVIICFTGLPIEARSWSAEESALTRKCEESQSVRRFRMLVESAGELSDASRKSRNLEASDLALAYMLYGSVLSESDSTLSGMVEEATVRIKDSGKTVSPAAVWLHIALAEYYISDIDYPKATDHALESLKMAEQLHSDDLAVIALSQLAHIYSNKEDASGIRWARQCWLRAEKTHSPSSRYLANVNLGAYLLKEGNSRQAQALFVKADSIAHATGMVGEYSYLYTFRAEILVRLGQYEEAERYFRLALADYDYTLPRDRWYARVSYASFLNSRHRYREALSLFQQAEGLAVGRKPYAQEYYVRLQKAEALEALGDYTDALETYKEYHQLSTEAMSAEKEKEIAGLEVRYRLAEQESLNSRQTAELMRKKRDLTLALAVCVILAMILVAFAIFHIKRLHYSRRMTDINVKAASYERQLRLQLVETLKRKEDHRKAGAEHLQEKLDTLYLHLNELMERQYVYRDSSLTLEKLASLLSTNRTYLSQAIKLKTGMSYSSYINELRLNEAIRVLSTSDSSDIVKTVATSVGFYNQSNFYRLFKQKTGLSPAQFRQQAYKSGSDEQSQSDNNVGS